MARRRRWVATKAQRADEKRWREREKLKDAFLVEGVAVFRLLRRIAHSFEEHSKRQKAEAIKHRRENLIADKKWKAHMKKIARDIKKRDAKKVSK